MAKTVENPELEALQANLKNGPPEKFFKFIRAEIKAVDPDKHEIEAVISTASIDRDREVILPSAFRKARGTRVPLVSSHDYSDLGKQIGEVMSLKITDDAVIARLRYIVGRGNGEADWAWVLAGEEDLAGFSVGFMPEKWTDADIMDDKIMRDVLAGKIPLRTYMAVELLEVSQVIVPSNRDAVQRMVEKGLFTQEDVLKILHVEAGYKEKLKPSEVPIAPAGGSTPPAPVPSPAPTPPEEDVINLLTEPHPTPAPSTPENQSGWTVTHAANGALQFKIIGPTGQTLFEGAPEQMVALLQGEGPVRAITVNVDVEPITVALRASLEAWQKGFIPAVQKALADAQPAAPALPAESVATLTGDDLAKVIAQVATKAAHDAARAEIQRHLGNVDKY